jgi:hypothetical protein
MTDILMCWLYHICHSTSIWYVHCIICHSTSIWYVGCIISVILLPCDMLTVSYLSFHFHLICWMYYICHSTSIWYVDCIICHSTRYDTLNISDRSRLTDMIHSIYQMEVEWQIRYSQHIRWKWNDIYDSQHIIWKWNDRYDTVSQSYGSGVIPLPSDRLTISYVILLPSDVLTVSYLSFHFHLICWVYHICHCTSIWYVECIISVIPLPSDMLTVLYLSFYFHVICWLYHICHSTSIWYVECIIFVSDGSGMTDMIQSSYQMEVEWQIWYIQHIW